MFRDVPPFRPEITVPTLDLPIHAGIHVHRTNLLAAADIVVVDHIPCTAPPRTCLDLGAVLPYELVEPIVQDAVIRKLVTHAELLAVLERVGGRGRRGTAALRAVVHGALPDERIESELERLLIALLPPGHGFTLQYEMTCVDGRRVRLDAARPEYKIAVEANGHRWHATAEQMRKDMARRRSIQASGYELWEYGWSDVVETPALVQSELAALVQRCQ
jgi:very-short-patch-repair endonuclease